MRHVSPSTWSIALSAGYAGRPLADHDAELGFVMDFADVRRNPNRVARADDRGRGLQEHRAARTAAACSSPPRDPCSSARWQRPSTASPDTECAPGFTLPALQLRAASSEQPVEHIAVDEPIRAARFHRVARGAFVLDSEQPGRGHRIVSSTRFRRRALIAAASIGRPPPLCRRRCGPAATVVSRNDVSVIGAGVRGESLSPGASPRKTR